MQIVPNQNTRNKYPYALRNCFQIGMTYDSKARLWRERWRENVSI